MDLFIFCGSAKRKIPRPMKFIKMSNPKFFSLSKRSANLKKKINLRDKLFCHLANLWIKSFLGIKGTV
jgi:hypothetical protein